MSTPDSDDPRPVYTGTQEDKAALGRHGAAVRDWRKRERARQDALVLARAGRMDTGSDQRDSRAANLSALEAIRDTATHPSDRVRAVAELERIATRQAEEAQAEAHGPLLALHAALCLLPEHERAEALTVALRGADPAEPADPATPTPVDPHTLAAPTVGT